MTENDINKRHETRMAKKKAVIDESIKKEMGEKIRVLRRKMSMTQPSLAHHLGVSYQMIQKFEGGISQIGVCQLYILSKVLEKDYSYFFPES